MPVATGDEATNGSSVEEELESDREDESSMAAKPHRADRNRFGSTNPAQCPNVDYQPVQEMSDIPVPRASAQPRRSRLKSKSDRKTPPNHYDRSTYKRT